MLVNELVSEVVRVLMFSDHMIDANDLMLDEEVSEVVIDKINRHEDSIRRDVIEKVEEFKKKLIEEYVEVHEFCFTN